VFNLTEESTRVRALIQSSPSATKLRIINTLLDRLHGYYSQCQQKYTEESGDKATYEQAYREAEHYLNFIETYCAEWLATLEEDPVKSKYIDYSRYAKLYLFTECKPPHPSLSLHSSIWNDANVSTI